MNRGFKIIVLSLAALLGAAVLSPVAAVAAPPDGNPAPHIVGIEHVNDRWDKVSVYSAAMDKVVVNDVMKSPRSGSPTFYLLPGIDGGDNLDPGATFAPGAKSWFGFTDLQSFFANKNVNVVSPLGGAFSWYTDWVNDPSKQYQTYMTQELPPLINAQYKANGRNAVGGLSSTGGTAVDYAVQKPGLYQAVGSYSGFLTPASGAQNVSLTLSSGGASADAMWGPPGGPLWVQHDPSLNVARLKGTAVFVTASGGGQGDVDKLPPGTNNFAGGFIEGIVNDSTRQFNDAAVAAGVPVTYVVRPDGSHSWGLFEAEMHDSWNMTIGPALGV